MATTESPSSTTTITDLPSDRDYDTDADAELDAALVDAIQKARAANNDYLATVLENELKSHYYDAQL